MPTPRQRRLSPDSRRPIPWTELRRHATSVFLMLQAGWAALEDGERDEVRRLMKKSRGRPRNLTRDEARKLGRLAGKAATAARSAAPRRR
jgi:hypothetical protein